MGPEDVGKIPGGKCCSGISFRIHWPSVFHCVCEHPGRVARGFEAGASPRLAVNRVSLHFESSRVLFCVVEACSGRKSPKRCCCGACSDVPGKGEGARVEVSRWSWRLFLRWLCPEHKRLMSHPPDARSHSFNLHHDHAQSRSAERIYLS